VHVLSTLSRLAVLLFRSPSTFFGVTITKAEIQRLLPLFDSRDHSIIFLCLFDSVFSLFVGVVNFFAFLFFGLFSVTPPFPYLHPSRRLVVFFDANQNKPVELKRQNF